MRNLYDDARLSGRIDSAGTVDWNAGNSADRRAIQVCSEHKIDISSHRARRVTADDARNFDLLCVMDRSNEKDLSRMIPPAMTGKVVRLTSFLNDKSITEVPDPYHSDYRAFVETYELIDRACSTLMREIEKNGVF